MRDGPHVGKVRSGDPPWYPLTQGSPLSRNTEKLGSPNLEVWTIPSTIVYIEGPTVCKQWCDGEVQTPNINFLFSSEMYVNSMSVT